MFNKPTLDLFSATLLIHALPDADGSRCARPFEEPNQWPRATWRGFVDPAEAQRGAENYLRHAGDFRRACLLNDNLALRGPWFDRVGWLERAWLPHALRLGLRYLAHVVQADTRTDMLTLTFPRPIRGQVELRLFYQLAEAEAWLRFCQQQAH